QRPDVSVVLPDVLKLHQGGLAGRRLLGGVLRIGGGCGHQEASARRRTIRFRTVAIRSISPRKNWNQSAFQDRKSTRLNSSHVSISYAVFCLKKKIIDTYTVSSTT